jgi:SAM-dependent methyltransferase
MATPAQLRRQLAKSVAASVDAPPSLYPLLPELLLGLESLGSRPRLILSLLRRANLPARPRVLDLACGKGSVSLALARAFNARVLGLDACPAFIDHAAARAASLNLADRTLFEVADVHAFLAERPKNADRFDLALMLNLLPALNAAPLLRRWTKPGGLYLIDDAVLAPRRSRQPIDPAFADVPTAADVAAAITNSGDTILATRIITPAEHTRLESRLRATISRNITRLIPHHPRLAETLRDYRRRQRESAALLAGPLRGSIWLVRRTGR